MLLFFIPLILAWFCHMVHSILKFIAVLGIRFEERGDFDAFGITYIFRKEKRKEMKEKKLNVRNKLILIVFVSFFFSILSVRSQEIQISPDSLVKKTSIPLSEIPTEFTIVSDQLIEIAKAGQVREKIVTNDSLVSIFYDRLLADKQEIEKTLPSMTYQGLERLNRAWHNYKNKFDDIQEVLNYRVIEIESSKIKLAEELEKWKSTSDELTKTNLHKEFKLYTDSAQTIIEFRQLETNERFDQLLHMQSRQNKLNLLIAETIRLLEEEQAVFQSNYFVLDSDPIWSASDSTAQFQNVNSYLKTEFTDNYQNLKIYLLSNKGIGFIQIIFVISLIFGFIVLSRIWTTDRLDENSKREVQAGFIIRRPFFSSLLISLVISVFFYSNEPQVLTGFFVMLMIISSLVLLPGLISKKIRWPMIILLVLYMINLIQDFLPYTSIANRTIIIFQSLASLYLLFIADRIKREFKLIPRTERLYDIVVRIFGILLIVALIANIIGSVKLADFLISSTIRTVNFSMISITLVIIMNSMLILLIKGKQTQSMPLYDQLKTLIDKRIRPLINWIGLLLWLFAALIYFRLLKPVEDMIDHLMNFEFPIASLSISVGSIISFFLIIFFTYLIVKLIKSIFKEDIISNKFPKGSIDAISMICRYTIVSIGIYLALGALGVSMSKLGFIIGALGVGIGFGLQSIVLNFIAGLILNIERPLHVGDIIEVDQYMGRITEIGVRASNILTFDGSEVIVPNGLLISNKVVNWTHSNEVRRLVIVFKTSPEVDPEQVIEILTEVAAHHPNTLDKPNPMTVFDGEDQFHLNFTLYCWVEFKNGLSTKSELYINGKKSLEAKGIKAPIPVFIAHLESNHPGHSPEKK